MSSEKYQKPLWKPLFPCSSKKILLVIAKNTKTEKKRCGKKGEKAKKSKTNLFTPVWPDYARVDHLTTVVDGQKVVAERWSHCCRALLDLPLDALLAIPASVCDKSFREHAQKNVGITSRTVDEMLQLLLQVFDNTITSCTTSNTAISVKQTTTAVGTRFPVIIVQWFMLVLSCSRWSLGHILMSYRSENRKQTSNITRTDHNKACGKCIKRKIPHRPPFCQ